MLGLHRHDQEVGELAARLAVRHRSRWVTAWSWSLCAEPRRLGGRRLCPAGCRTPRRTVTPRSGRSRRPDSRCARPHRSEVSGRSSIGTVRWPASSTVHPGARLGVLHLLRVRPASRSAARRRLAAVRRNSLRCPPPPTVEDSAAGSRWCGRPNCGARRAFARRTTGAGNELVQPFGRRDGVPRVAVPRQDERRLSDVG